MADILSVAQTFKIMVSAKYETSAEKIVAAAHQSGITGLNACVVCRLYFLRGTLSPDDARRLAVELLADPVTELFTLSAGNSDHPLAEPDTVTVEVTRLPGVTDPPAENLLRAAHRLGITGLAQAATGQQYRLAGELSARDVQRLAVEILSNPVIEQVAINTPIAPPFVPTRRADTTVETIPLSSATNSELESISAARRLALNLAEMQAVQAYFRRENREPTDVELETIAQTWSEHCVHKTFSANITYTGPAPGSGPNATPVTQTINGLFKTYIKAATEQVNKPWLKSVFVDNAGIIAFDDRFDLAFKAETHNHPSALEPFGGANTGVGGVIRDVLGVSARPIANTDVLCFGPPDLPAASLPEGVLHPRRIADGVVHGVEDYGNKMGIPTVNGAILYHEGYTANPLVFVGCLGLLPRNSHRTAPQPGDLIVVIGGRTGRDGLRGATFSSMEMDQDTGDIAGAAVQIGHPIHEKQTMEVILRARDEGLYHAITDCGAGGLSSAVGEMAEHLGAEVQLTTVPLKYPGLRPWEIWLSEAQERMVLAVPPANWMRMQEICVGQNVEAVAIGAFTDSGHLLLQYDDRTVASLNLSFLHHGLPTHHLTAEWHSPQLATPTLQPQTRNTEPKTHNPTLLTLLAHPNISSKESVVRRYDHEVQGGAVVKPLVGADNHGPGDAAVLVPPGTQRADGTKGVALAAGICPAYGELDPYAMAWAAMDESLRNLVAVGADPDQVAVLDNFCWGNPNLPDRLGGLVRAAQGCFDAARAFRVPFISGKDSLNNEYTGADGKKHAIPGTLLISAVGIVPDTRQSVTMDLKRAGNVLVAVGETRAELGGSHFQLISNDDEFYGPPPQPTPNALTHLRALHRAISAGVVQACHDCSEGGVAVALAEMALAGRLGAQVSLVNLPATTDLTATARLFSESLTRFIIEISPPDLPRLAELLAAVPHAPIGTVGGTRLTVRGEGGIALIDLPIAELELAWRGTAGQPAGAAGKIPTPAPKLAVPRLAQLPRVLILHANGTNRDHDAAAAVTQAGGAPTIAHINQLISGEISLLDFGMLVVPGGFSYGDDLGAGTLWAFDLRHYLGAQLFKFMESGRPVLGICNGFQTLVKSGLLPGVNGGNQRTVTLAPNASGRFECRWVYLQPNPHSPSLFTQGLTTPIYCPVAHGEGRVAVADDSVLTAIQSKHLNALSYTTADGSPADYPANPNGSVLGIAGLCNPAGNVLGLMPHPENHIFPWQHPRWHRGEQGMSGLVLFENAIRGI